MQTRFLTFLLTLSAVGGINAAVPACMAARNGCISRIACSMALNNFHIACDRVKLGQVAHCTDSCMRAIVALITVDGGVGMDYLTCDCAGNPDCKTWKNRMAVCSDDALEALRSLDNEDRVSCSLARMLCEANSRCLSDLEYYEELCSNMWVKHSSKKLECSPRCNNSAAILYRQTRGAKLKNCICDNTDPVVDEETCINMRYNTQTYCFGSEPSQPFIANVKIQPPDRVKANKPARYISTRLAASTASGASVTLPLTLTIHIILGYIIINW